MEWPSSSAYRLDSGPTAPTSAASLQPMQVHNGIGAQEQLRAPYAYSPMASDIASSLHAGRSPDVWHSFDKPDDALGLGNDEGRHTVAFGVSVGQSAAPLRPVSSASIAG